MDTTRYRPIRAPHRIKDRTGDRYGRLTALRPIGGTIGYQVVWECRCDCGSISTHVGHSLASRHVRSCGCLRREETQHRVTTHGLSKTPEYRAWVNLKGRCHNPTYQAFRHYGGRGIRTWWGWRRSFERFISDMGPRPTPRHSIDRINNDRGYCPSNCRWATWSEQARNKRPRARVAA